MIYEIILNKNEEGPPFPQVHKKYETLITIHFRFFAVQHLFNLNLPFLARNKQRNKKVFPCRYYDWCENLHSVKFFFGFKTEKFQIRPKSLKNALYFVRNWQNRGAIFATNGRICKYHGRTCKYHSDICFFPNKNLCMKKKDSLYILQPGKENNFRNIYISKRTLAKYLCIGNSSIHVVLKRFYTLKEVFPEFQIFLLANISLRKSKETRPFHFLDCKPKQTIQLIPLKHQLVSGVLSSRFLFLLIIFCLAGPTSCQEGNQGLCREGFLFLPCNNQPTPRVANNIKRTARKY